jgi:hypothetical protein
MGKKSNRFSTAIRERAACMLLEHQGEYPSLWGTIEDIGPKICCVPQTLNECSARLDLFHQLKLWLFNKLPL